MFFIFFYILIYSNLCRHGLSEILYRLDAKTIPEKPNQFHMSSRHVHYCNINNNCRQISPKAITNHGQRLMLSLISPNIVTNCKSMIIVGLHSVRSVYLSNVVVRKIQRFGNDYEKKIGQI